MEARDFIYHFTDILFSQITNSTTLIENWEEKDFDLRYVEYADIFVRMKESCLDAGRTDNEIFTMLRNSRSAIVKSFNEIMKQNLADEFARNGISAIVFEQLLPMDVIKEGSINTKCLELFRGFEERTFTKRPEIEV